MRYWMRGSEMVSCLILGGTAEAHETIAAMLAGSNPPKIILSLAGLHKPNREIPPEVTLRSGGFGGVAGLVTYLQDHSISILIDATHPFAASMARNAASAAKSCRIPAIKLLRPVTEIPAGLRVSRVPSLNDASDLANQLDMPIMLALGKRGNMVFLSESQLPHEKINAPLSFSDRSPLLQQLADSHAQILVLRDSGSERTAEWLAASLALDITVILIDRPLPPSAVPIATSVAEVVEWYLNLPPQSA